MKLINFYEIVDRKGEIQTGTASPGEAISWFRRGLSTSVFVSVWDEEDIEEPVLVTDKIDVTNLLLALMLQERDENIVPKPKKEWS